MYPISTEIDNNRVNKVGLVVVMATEYSKYGTK